MEINTIYNVDAKEGHKLLNDNSINTIITSPPYYGLRDYGVNGQIGLEETPEMYVNNLVEIFRNLKTKLRDDGTLWLNLGDSYCGGSYGMSENNDPKNNKTKGMNQRGLRICEFCKKEYMGTINQRFCSKPCVGVDNTPRVKKGLLKPKDLIGIPWMVAFALRSDGWYLRQDIIWHKPNPMPESVTDRCTKAHEYIFLFSKSSKYYFDNEAIRESAKDPESYSGKRKRSYKRENEFADKFLKQNFRNIKIGQLYEKVNKRSVWTVTTKPFTEAHFATYPEELIKDCILAGCPEFVCNVCKEPYKIDIERVDRDYFKKEDCKTKQYAKSNHNEKIEYKNNGYIPSCNCNAEKEGGIVLDPFMGAGTTALVSKKYGRNYIGFELNPEYINIAENRLMKELGIFYKNDM